MDTLAISTTEGSYFKGGHTHAVEANSLLRSSSKWLNSPVLRDTIAQEALRRNGKDVGVLQLLPEVMNEFHRVLGAAEIDRLMQQERARNPDFAKWLDGRGIAPLDLSCVGRFKPGTLGSELSGFLMTTGFEQQIAYRELEPENDWERFSKQRALIHDIEHVISGFGSDPIGEIGLMYADMCSHVRYFSPELSSVMCFSFSYLMSTWMMRINLHYPELMPTFFDAVGIGTTMGQTLVRPFVLVDWEQYYDWPIADIRRELGIERCPAPDAWAWTDKAWLD
ncbi:MAG: hypothetical protein JSR19_09580 [Proteobacteria bacterium]|nr:hypothetical protein [Pseudomonadota bacterium]HQR04097.1 hypothetical protein [Rhodocyclaceae bacterium]